MLRISGRAAHRDDERPTIAWLDTSPEEFRRQLHDLADWIADFRQNLGSLKVAPNDKPGAVYRPRSPRSHLKEVKRLIIF